MNDFFMGMIALAILVAAGAFVVVMMERKRTLRSAREFLKTTESSFKPALEELQADLKRIPQAASNMEAGPLHFLMKFQENLWESRWRENTIFFLDARHMTSLPDIGRSMEKCGLR